MTYCILTDKQLNLASAFERWQMATKGNVLRDEPRIPYSPAPDTRLVVHAELEQLTHPDKYYGHGE